MTRVNRWHRAGSGFPSTGPVIVSGMTAEQPRDLDAAAEAALARLVALLRKAGSAREAAWAISSEAIAALGLEDCIVYLVDATGTILTQVAAYGPKLKAPKVIEHPITLRVGQGVVGACAASRTIQRIDDTRTDPRYVVDDEPRVSELALPLIHHDLLLGVLDSEHSSTGFYSDRHVRVLQQMALLLSERLAQLRNGDAPG
jgi:putative methionine-R-sulfoxide reductase with GAF domain